MQLSNVVIAKAQPQAEGRSCGNDGGSGHSSSVLVRPLSLMAMSQKPGKPICDNMIAQQRVAASYTDSVAGGRGHRSADCCMIVVESHLYKFLLFSHPFDHHQLQHHLQSFLPEPNKINTIVQIQHEVPSSRCPGFPCERCFS